MERAIEVAVRGEDLPVYRVKGVLDVLDPHPLNHPEHQAGVLIRRARLARLSGFADAEGQSLLAAAGQLLPPEGVPADRVLWFVESAFAALRDEDPARAAASLAELERRTADVGLTISPPERRHLDQLPELHAWSLVHVPTGTGPAGRHQV